MEFLSNWMDSQSRNSCLLPSQHVLGHFYRLKTLFARPLADGNVENEMGRVSWRPAFMIAGCGHYIENGLNLQEQSRGR